MLVQNMATLAIVEIAKVAIFVQAYSGRES